MIEHKAFISGLTPTLTMEKIFNGNTSNSGPVTKKLMITSSIDKVKLNNHPAKIAGHSKGIKILLKIVKSVAPKSLAASIKFLLVPLNLEYTVIITNGKQNVICDNNKDQKPKGILIEEKRINKEMPVTISGDTININRILCSNFLPKNLYRYKDTAAIVPIIVAIVADNIPMVKECNAIICKSVLFNKFLYHCRVNPLQINENDESLKE